MKKKKIIAIVGVVIFAAALALTLVLCLVKDDDVSIKDYYAKKLIQFDEQNQLFSDVDVVFLGDSLTEGYNLQRYYPDLKTFNRGIGGETTFGLENRLQVSVFDVQPKVAVMLIGGNNLTTMFDNYETLLIKLRDNLPNTKIIICSLTAFGREFARYNPVVEESNVRIEALAAKYGYGFVNLYEPLFNKATNEIYEEYTKEGVHLTRQGYEVVTATLSPAVYAALQG